MYLVATDSGGWDQTVCRRQQSAA